MNHRTRDWACQVVLLVLLNFAGSAVSKSLCSSFHLIGQQSKAQNGLERAANETRPDLCRASVALLAMAGSLALRTDLILGLGVTGSLAVLTLIVYQRTMKSRRFTAELLASRQRLRTEIAERRKIEETLDDLNKKLEAANREVRRANKELQEFARIAAHDLKTPLRAIGTLADWIATDYADKFDPQGREQVRLLVTKAKQMTALIDDILHYSGVSCSAQKPQPVDLNVLVADVIAELDPPDHIEATAEKNLPTIVGKRTHLVQIFQNLLGNAVKYMDKPKGRIRVACAEQHDFWQFSVADNGPGIDAKYFEKIFEIFQTLGPRDSIESTGIGLSIVKKLVELNGGRVWVESQVGQGSTFFFTLPKLAVCP